MQNNDSHVIKRKAALTLHLFKNIMDNLEFTKESILSTIIKLSLKTFCECVRLEYFSTFGYQQIEVDLFYLKDRLLEYLEEKK